MVKKKSWREKLEYDGDLPKVEKIPAKMVHKWGSGMIVIPAPRQVDAIMRQVRKGKLITIAEIRDALAKRHGATICCPFTAGIFAWISAHAAEEGAANGIKRTTPYWRTLKTGGELNPKYPGGLSAQKRQLESEGHKIIARGKRWFVHNFQKHVAIPRIVDGL